MTSNAFILAKKFLLIEVPVYFPGLSNNWNLNSVNSGYGLSLLLSSLINVTVLFVKSVPTVDSYICLKVPFANLLNKLDFPVLYIKIY